MRVSARDILFVWMSTVLSSRSWILQSFLAKPSFFTILTVLIFHHTNVLLTVLNINKAFYWFPGSVLIDNNSSKFQYIGPLDHISLCPSPHSMWSRCCCITPPQPFSFRILPFVGNLKLMRIVPKYFHMSCIPFLLCLLWQRVRIIRNISVWP